MSHSLIALLLATSSERLRCIAAAWGLPADPLPRAPAVYHAMTDPAALTAHCVALELAERQLLARLLRTGVAATLGDLVAALPLDTPAALAAIDALGRRGFLFSPDRPRELGAAIAGPAPDLARLMRLSVALPSDLVRPLRERVL